MTIFPTVVVWLCILGMAGATGIALLYFQPLLALWLVLLSVATYRHPTWGASILLVSLSIDTVAPILGEIEVSFSELQLANGLLAFLAQSRGRNLDWRPVIWGAGFVGAVLLSAIANIETYKVLPHLARLSEWLAACFLMLNVYKSKSLGGAQWTLFVAGLFFCLVGLSQADLEAGGRVVSFFDNPNQFSGYLGMLFPVAAMFFLSAAGKWIGLVWGCLSLMVLVTLLVTASRAALLGALIVGLVLLSLHLAATLRSAQLPLAEALRRVRNTMLKHVLIGSLIIGLLFVLGVFDPLTARISRSLGASPHVSSVASLIAPRLPYLRAGLEIWGAHPLLGVGPGKWKESTDRFLRTVDSDWPEMASWNPAKREVFGRNLSIHCHNLYIQLGANYGVLGLLGFLAWIACALRLFGIDSSTWSRAGLGLIIAFLIHNLFDVTFPSLSQEMGCLLGLCLTGWGRDSNQSNMA